MSLDSLISTELSPVKPKPHIDKHPGEPLLTVEEHGTMSLRGDRLKVAIIGAGPAGLAAAIKLSRLTFVDWKIYDQARELREVGAGISIQPNTWRLLEDLDVAKNFHYTEIFRPVDNHVAKHR